MMEIYDRSKEKRDKRNYRVTYRMRRRRGCKKSMELFMSFVIWEP